MKTNYPYYVIHPPWSHIWCQPYLNSWLWSIRTSLTRNQAPHPLPGWLPAPSHNVSLWPWCHYHSWPPSIGFPRQLPIPKDIQWPCCFFRWCRRPFPQWQTFHILRRPLFFWVFMFIGHPKPNQPLQPFPQTLNSAPYTCPQIMSNGYDLLYKTLGSKSLMLILPSITTVNLQLIL